MNKSVKVFCWTLIGLGVFFRFYNISQNQFFYYDEGMYLRHNIEFLQKVHAQPPQDFPALFKFLSLAFHLALADTKSIWLFFLYLRTLFLTPEAWFYGRILSALFGSLSLYLTYLIGRKLFDSKETALLAASLLALLPSHIFYSRLAMQESLSTLFLLLAVYYYITANRAGGRVILSGIFLACIYYTNYRMIIAPAIIFLVELFLSFSSQVRFNFKKYVWQTVAFLVGVFGIGALDGGRHTFVTFSWMFHQSDQAHGHFDWLNLLSYPYYVFSLETGLFGLFFFGGLFYGIKKDWKKFLPCAIVLFQMLIFSLPQEKGVRYLCVVMPFMVLTVAVVISDLGRFYSMKKAAQVIFAGVVLLMCLNQSLEALSIIQFKSSYEESVKAIPSSVGVLTSQPLLQKMFVAQPRRVDSVSAQGWAYYLAYLKRGYRFVILDPQAYVSYTSDTKRFTYELIGPLGFMKHNLRPVKIYDHFSYPLLKRFVLEHNENLVQSLKFLKENRSQKFNQIYVYDLKQAVILMARKAKNIR